MEPRVEVLTCILTRRCNLSCYYCRISGCPNYKDKPKIYPSMADLIKNEKGCYWWIDVINRFMKHNPKIFVIFIGGEPFLYKQLVDIIMHAKVLDLNYTIISNSTKELKPIRDKFFREVGKIRGYTASIDPGFEKLVSVDKHSEDSLRKSSEGFDTLIDLMKQGLVEDPVAELTVTSESIHLVEGTIKTLDSFGIWSDLTVVDIAKTPYYDFSNITDEKLLVQQTDEVKEIFNRLINSDYKIHMKDLLLPSIFDILPANNNCDSCCNARHNLTIDADGSIRLCYRIRGEFGPGFTGLDFVDRFGNLTRTTDKIQNVLAADKKLYCNGCAWTCPLMSIFDEDEIITHGEPDEQ